MSHLPYIFIYLLSCGDVDIVIDPDKKAIMEPSESLTPPPWHGYCTV